MESTLNGHVGSGADFGDVVRPSDCALAIGIPLSLDELNLDWIRSDAEFVRQVVGAQFQAASAEDAWNCGYSMLVADLRDVIESVRGLGVAVIEDARLADLCGLFNTYRVVSILAHGPFPLLSLEDVVDSKRLLAAFEEARAGSNAEEPALIKWLLGFTDVRNARTLEALVKSLRRLLGRSRSFFHRRLDYSSGGDLLRAYELDDINKGGVTRLLLQEALPGVFRSPPVLELRDGIHDYDSFVSTIPRGFSGTIDLTLCSALWIGEPLRRLRPNCTDILCLKQLAYVEARARLYWGTISQLAHRPMRFAHAAWIVHQSLIAMSRGAESV